MKFKSSMVSNRHIVPYSKAIHQCLWSSCSHTVTNVKVKKANGSKGKKRKTPGVSPGNENEKKEWYQANYTMYLSNSEGQLMRND